MERSNIMEAVIPIVAFLCILLLRVCDGMEGDSNVGCHLHEREALTKFKNGLSDPHNHLSSWDHLSDCCKWRGVACHNRTRYVIKLNLHNLCDPRYAGVPIHQCLDLNGRLDPALLDLKHLRSLDLSKNDFQGVSIPSFLGSFKELKYLNLSHSNFGGEIPHQLGNLSNLECLDVSSSLFYGGSLHSNQIQWLMGMTSLKILNMGGVDFSKARTSLLHALSALPFLSELRLRNCGPLKTLFPQPPVPVNLTSLQFLDLRENYLGNSIFRFVVNISSIESIYLADNQIHGPVPNELKQLPYLQVLALGDNEITANFPELLEGGWRSIKTLYLEGNNITGEIPTSIGNLTSLVSVGFANNFISGCIPETIGDLASLVHLDLSYNNISGKVPATIGKLCTLEALYLYGNTLEELPQDLTGAHSCDEGHSLPDLTVVDLHDNSLGGAIPSWMGHLASLQRLDFSRNKLHGSIPATFGKLSKLEYADTSNNSLTGILNDTHFQELKSLNSLYMSSNELVFRLKSDWIPPFQLRFLFLKSCILGPNFPHWLNTQKSIVQLDLSNTGIEGSVPSLFWNLTSQLSFLDISHNSIEGQLPNQLVLDHALRVNLSFNHFSGPLPCLLNSSMLDFLDLSDNQFSGPIPEIFTDGSSLTGITLSRNRISGTIPSWLGKMEILFFLDLSHNNLSGIIPFNIGNCTFLRVLDLSDNSLLGGIPLSFGWLKRLSSLHLNKNVLSGNLPSSLQNCSDLIFLDLGDNNFCGSIKSLISDSHTDMRALRLASNKFTGEIPSNMSCMSFLQIFDVSNNFLSGLIPQTLGNLTAMTRITRRQREGLWDWDVSTWSFSRSAEYMHYNEELFLSTKGLMLEYTKTLYLFKSIDLSSNNFHGEIPDELTMLIELFSLNLSNNHLTGKIPRNIGNLEMLESLDLSNNHFTGEIPLGLSRLLKLARLNLSNNNLEGEIPSGNQLQTLIDPSIYLGNRELCGAPLATKCPTSETTAVEHGSKGGEGHDKLCFYISMIFGFVAGFWGICGLLIFKRSIRILYFRFFDNIGDKIFVLVGLVAAKFH